MSDPVVSTEDLLKFLCSSGSPRAVNWVGEVSGPVSFARPQHPDGCAFCEADDPSALESLEPESARVLLVTRTALERLPGGLPERTLIGCESPRLAFVRLVDRYWCEDPGGELGSGEGIHPSVDIPPSAWVAPGVVVGPGCQIGEHSVIHAGVKLYRGVCVGAHVRIDANAVIGGPGFGFVRDPDVGWRRFPQRASVVLGDRVEIGAGACIDRGALSDTIIGSGTKIDNLTYVAHNVIVGRDCLIMASSILAGSCRVEDDAVISPGAKVRDYCLVGRGAHVGMGAVVVSDVPAGSVVAGVPAAPIRDASKRN